MHFLDINLRSMEFDMYRRVNAFLRSKICQALVGSMLVLAACESAWGADSVLPEIDWQGLRVRHILVTADDQVVRTLLTEKFSGSQESHLKLAAKSFYNVLYQQQGLPRQRYSLTDALAGREPDRTKFRYAVCGTKIDNTAGKAQNGAIGRDAGMQAANLNGTLSNSQLMGVGVVVGLVSALATDQEKVLSCDEDVTVCPISAMFCTWHESVVTDFTLYDGDRAIAQSKKFVERTGRGFEPKELAQKHLEQLKAL